MAISFDRLKRARLGATLLFAVAFGAAYGQLSYVDVHDFAGTATDGADSYSTVNFDSSGNAYGTASLGGANNKGLIWEISSGGTFIDLHDFAGSDGANPSSGVSFDSQGDMFGTAQNGGANGDGLVWEITSSGMFKDLHDFGTGDGISPYAGVTLDSAGDKFGVTTQGGGTFSGGMVWEITAGGAYMNLHNFGGPITLSNGNGGTDGAYPLSQVAVDSSGDLFGTTRFGGAADAGVIWEINSGGTYFDRHDFAGTITWANGSSGQDGRWPYAGVTLNSAGDLFGATTMGGQNGDGMVWEFTTAGSYTDLHDFGNTITNANGSSGNDGRIPLGVLAFDASGNLYGTASEGGPNGTTPGDGMVWEITSGGTYKDLHDFGGTVTNANGTKGNDGTAPNGGVSVDSSGSLHGTTFMGGPGTDGNVWTLAGPEHVAGLSLSPSTIGGLGTSTGTVTLSSPAPTGGWAVGLHAGASGYLSMPTSITVPAGATTATFTITGTAQRPSTINMGVFASDNTSSKEQILVIQGDSLQSFTLSPSQIKWTSGTSTATLTIGSAAPPGGWTVKLTPGVAGYVNIPTTVTVPAGSTSTTFSITGNELRFFTLNLGITASDGASKATATLVIAGDAVKSISLSPTTIGWGGTSTATVNLVVAAPPGGWLVNTNPGAAGYVSMPTSITVPAGATSATFTITAGSQRSSNLTMGIYANDGPSNQSATLTIQGDSVKSLTLNPSTITALGTSTATVTLSSAAPPGGWVLTMHPGASGFVNMPTTLTVPAGATSATFTITGITQHSSTVNLGIFVSDGNSSQEAILTIT